jgi:hypothetical protein
MMLDACACVCVACCDVLCLFQEMNVLVLLSTTHVFGHHLMEYWYDAHASLQDLGAKVHDAQTLCEAAEPESLPLSEWPTWGLDELERWCVPVCVCLCVCVCM